MHSPGVGVFVQRSLILCFLTVLMSLSSFRRGLSTINGADGLTLAPVYWNASNPMFKPSINNPVIEVQLRDEIDFVCPWDVSNGSDGHAEYYVIYQVSRKEYESCSLFTEDRKPLMIVNCNAPEAKRRFTVIFEPYQSIPNVPEYKIGMTYYYTTTSTGKMDGLSSLNNGACRDFNMKLAFYICCPTSVATQLPVTNSTTVITSTRSTTVSSAPSLKTTASDKTQSASQFPTPTSPSSTTTTTMPSTSTSSTSRSNLSLVPKSDNKTTSAVLINDISTTKITQLPQPSYQQTVNGSTKRIQTILLLLPLLILVHLYNGRT